MAHQALKSAYDRLTDRLNKFPQGAPSSELLHSILRLLFSEKEANLVALLPIKPFTAKQAAQAWKVGEAEACKTLDTLAGRAILLDFVSQSGNRRYMLPPPMVGFFEFSMMRVRGDLDQKALAELYADPKIKVTSFWTMGFNQHSRGTWVNNMIYNVHLLVGKISEPGNSPFSLTGQPSACGTARETGTFAHRLPADMLVANPAHRDAAEKIWKVPGGTIQAAPGLHAWRKAVHSRTAS